MKHAIHLIAAARPNFMKIAPLYHALSRTDWASPVIVHTGQHYDKNMSGAIFSDLSLPEPHINLGIGSGSHAEQTGRVMIAYESVLQKQRPEMVVVVGDVNSTMACTLAASKTHFDTWGSRISRPLVAHLEAGLRSFDRTMPEEINRLVTDVLADILWTPSPDADENLAREGVSPSKIVRVGNIMIDSLTMLRPQIDADDTCRRLGLARNTFAVVTLHRPSNVDDATVLAELCTMLERISKKLPVVFPVHPRTRKSLLNTGILPRLTDNPRITMLEPLGYIQFMNLITHCRLVITDSGGIQEETTYLGIHCLTMRPNTERPITISEGTNQLCTLGDVETRLDKLLAQQTRHTRVPDLWDGRTASRVVDSIYSALQGAARTASATGFNSDRRRGTLIA